MSRGENTSKTDGMNMTDKLIIRGFLAFDEKITKEYFYGYCRRAYIVYDYKYQLHNKPGLDFYSLAHNYYISLLLHKFKPLLDKPSDMKLSSWMMRGFYFVVQDALKAHNKEFKYLADTPSDTVLDYVRSSDTEEGMMQQVTNAVANHYHDRKMQEIARMIFYAGYKQKEVAAQLGMTPAAVNQRYKKMMDEVVTPFIMENYSRGLYLGVTPNHNVVSADASMPMSSMSLFCLDMEEEAPVHARTTPELITTLKPNEIFVFGSNLQGIHVGGAARTANLYFGAEMDNGVGLQGNSYAIPTMQGGVDTIKPYVDEFIAFAKAHQELIFYVTRIGCGIAGFTAGDIAPLFRDAIGIDNIYLPESFWDSL